MNCSTCENWDNCCESKCDSGGTIIESCFVGKTIVVDKLKLMQHIHTNKDKYLSKMHVIMLDAVQVSERMFNIRCIRLKQNRGRSYIGEIYNIQAYYSTSRGMYSIYYNGADLSMSREKFTRMFGLGVSDEVVKSRFCLANW